MSFQLQIFLQSEHLLAQQFLHLRPTLVNLVGVLLRSMGQSLFSISNSSGTLDASMARGFVVNISSWSSNRYVLSASDWPQCHPILLQSNILEHDYMLSAWPILVFCLNIDWKAGEGFIFWWMYSRTLKHAHVPSSGLPTSNNGAAKNLCLRLWISPTRWSWQYWIGWISGHSYGKAEISSSGKADF